MYNKSKKDFKKIMATQWQALCSPPPEGGADLPGHRGGQ